MKKESTEGGMTTSKTMGEIAHDAHTSRQSFNSQWGISQQEHEDECWEYVAQAVIEAHEAAKWQPIETAPKNSNYRTLKFIDGGFEHISTGWYERCLYKDFDTGLYVGGWTNGILHEDADFMYHVQPTGWQPLKQTKE